MRHPAHHQPQADTRTPPTTRHTSASPRRGSGVGTQGSRGQRAPWYQSNPRRASTTNRSFRGRLLPQEREKPRRANTGAFEHPFRLVPSTSQGGRMSVLTTVAHTLTRAVANAPRWSTSHDRPARAAQRPGAGARRRQARRPFRQHARTGRRPGLVICAITGRRVVPARVSGVADRG